MHERQSRLVAPEVTQQQHKTSRSKFKIEEDYGKNADLTENTNESHVSNFEDGQNEENKNRVDVVLVNSADCDTELNQTKNLVDGLSDVERLEIRQTMQQVYPEMALIQDARSNSRSKRNKKTNSRNYEKQFKTQRDYNYKMLNG